MNPTRSMPTPVPEPPVHAPGRAPKPVGHRVAEPAGSTSVDVAVSDRTRRLLDGPIVPTLLRLAAPNVVVMTVQVAVTAGEAYFLGWLGADALAGVSLTFPLIMLMQTMSAGGMGGGVTAAVARASAPVAGPRPTRWRCTPADRDRDGRPLHLGVLLGGPALYAAMGGTGVALAVALSYSHRVQRRDRGLAVQHAGQHRPRDRQHAPPGQCRRRRGRPHAEPLARPDLRVGTRASVGIAGAAVALVTYYAVGSLVLLGYLPSGRSLVRLVPRDLRLRGRLFGEILWVGAPRLLNNVQTNLTVVVLTGLVGPFGRPPSPATGWGRGWSICRSRWCSASDRRW